MKKTLTLLLGLAALTGCSKEETGNSDNGAPVPIELGAGVNVVSRAVIANNDAVTNAGIAGWEVPAVSGQPSTVDYSAQATWNTTISTTASTSPAAVTWTDQKYYNSEATTVTYLKAWYPGGTFDATNNTVTFTNTNGDQDVLLAPAISGSKSQKITSSTPLAFQHMTSQIKFSVKKGEGLAEGTKIESITIKNAQLPTGFDLAKGIDEDGAVTYATAADLTVPNIDGTQEITNTNAGDPAGDAVMIKPIASKTFSVDITTSNTTYENQTVTVTTDAVQAGYAYDITLTFGQAGIELTATVAKWQTAAGSAEIQ